MTTSIRSRLAIPCALLIGVVSLAASMAVAVPSASAASGPAGAEASELVRLINGARAANGLSALRLDPTLAGLAASTSMACPSDASLTMLGRARDGAENSYASHYLRLCPTVLFVSILQSTYHYGSVGEIMLQNRGYGTGQFALSYTGSRSTFSTATYSTTGHGLLGWMGSSSHRPIILGGYDRVGCGGWIAADGTFWYACEFSKGGPNGTTAPPTRSPFGGPAATAKPAPVATPRTNPNPPASRTSAPAPVRTAAPTTAPTTAPTATPAPTGSPTPVPTPMDSVLAANQANPSPSGLLAALEQQGGGAAGGAADFTRSNGGPNPASTSLGIATGIGALLTAIYGLFLAIRQRRRRTTSEA